MQRFPLQGILTSVVYEYSEKMLFLRNYALMLVYLSQSILLEEFCQILHYLIAANSTDVLVGDFNYDLLINY